MPPCTKPNSYIARFPDQIHDQYSLHYFRTFKIPCLIDPSSEVAGKNTENPIVFIRLSMHAACTANHQLAMQLAIYISVSAVPQFIAYCNFGGSKIRSYIASLL